MESLSESLRKRFQVEQELNKMMLTPEKRG
jgi:hypothetical protein